MSAKNEKPDAPERPAKKDETEAAAKKEKPKPDLPLFKISKVDPKNSFNFEDVADK